MYANFSPTLGIDFSFSSKEFATTMANSSLDIFSYIILVLLYTTLNHHFTILIISLAIVLTSSIVLFLPNEILIVPFAYS